MTHINDDEVAEVLWASSEEGRAAHQAAWEKAQQLGLSLDRADVGALVWAAHRAAEQ